MKSGNLNCPEHNVLDTPQHRKDHHRKHVICKRKNSTTEAVSIASMPRNADNLFQCITLGCNAAPFDKYMNAYNHLKRAGPDHFLDGSDEEEAEDEEAILVQGVFASSQKSVSKAIDDVERVSTQSQTSQDRISQTVEGDEDFTMGSPERESLSDELEYDDPLWDQLASQIPDSALSGAPEPASLSLSAANLTAIEKGCAEEQDDTSVDTQFKVRVLYNEDPRVLSSAFLNRLGAFIFELSESRRIYVCVKCQIGVHPEHILNHHRKEHPHAPPLTTMDKSDLKALNITPLDSLTSEEVSPSGFSPVPGIPYMLGWTCSHPGCNHCTLSQSKMKAHQRSHKQSGLQPVACTVQSLYFSNRRFYRVNLPIADEPGIPSPSSDIAKYSTDIYQGVVEELSSSIRLNDTDTSPFLRRHRSWMEIAAEISPETIASWVSAPQVSEPGLADLIPLVDEYFSELVAKMTGLGSEARTLTLRHINTAIGEINFTPFKVPLVKASVTRYTDLARDLYTFILRIVNGTDIRSRGTPLPPLNSAVLSAAHSLLNNLDAKCASTKDVHCLALALLKETVNTHTPAGENLRTNPVVLFIIYKSIAPSGVIRDPDSIQNFLTGYKWTTRASAFFELNGQLEALGPETDQEAMEREIEATTRLLKEGRFTNFAYVAQLSHYVNAVAANAVRMPRVMWQDVAGESLSFDGHPVIMEDFRNLYRRLLEETTTLLFDKILLGLDIPELFPKGAQIYDNLSDTTPGYSFINDPRNTFAQHRHFLLKAMVNFKVSGDRFVFPGHCNQDGPMWNMSGLLSWEKDVEKCLGCLFLLLHLGYGQPARGTELSILRWVNTPLHLRNFFFTSGFLNVVFVYNKTQSISEKQRLINRCPPGRVGELFIIWLALVVPTLVALVKATSSGDHANLIYFHAFASRHGLWDTDDFSSLLESVTGRPISLGGLGQPFSIAPFRHLAIAIMRRHIRAMIDQFSHLVEDVLPEQSGHTAKTAARYGIDRDTILNNNVEEEFRQFMLLSQLYHHFLLPEFTVDYPAVTTITQLADTSASSQASSVQLSPSDLTHISAQLAPRLGPQLAPLLIATLEKAMVDCHATLIGQLNSIRSDREIQQPTPRTALLRADGLRFQELRSLMSSSFARFKSHEQAAAAEYSARREGDLLVVLPTGGGKGLIFELPSFNRKELAARMVTIVVVPLLALLDDIKRRLRSHKIVHSQWTPDAHWGTAAPPSLVLVSADIAAFDGFMNFARELSVQKRLARVVIDEAHFILTAAHYREKLKDLKILRTLEAPMILLTASLPPSAQNRLLEAYACQPSMVTVVRASTERANLKYTFLPLLSGDILRFIDQNGNISEVVAYINNLVAALPKGERGIVFCLTKKDTENMAGYLGCDAYNSGLPFVDRGRAMTNFLSPEGKVIAATSGMGTGTDLPGVRWTVHWKQARSMLDQDQECGRAGRDDCPGQSVIFYTDGPSDSRTDQSKLGVTEQITWFKSNECRRLLRGEFMDGLAATCASLNALECDYCERIYGENPEADTSSPNYAPSKRKRESLGDKSPTVPPDLRVKPSNAVNVCISAAMAQKKRVSAILDTNECNAALKNWKRLILGSDFCTACWLHSSKYDHDGENNCRDFAMGWKDDRNLSSFKSALNLARGHCWFCGFWQQDTSIHPIGNKQHCPFVQARKDELFRHLFWAVWLDHTIRSAIAKVFTPDRKPWTTYRVYASWLVEVKEDGISNHIKVAAWVWQHGQFNSQANGTPSQSVASAVGTPSEIPSSSSSTVSISNNAEARRWCEEKKLGNQHLEALIEIGVYGAVDVQGLKALSRADWSERGVSPLVRNAIIRACE